MTAQPPPPAYPPPQPAGQAPKNYLVWSILVTLFCCLPLGIVAIVKSASVNGLWAQGQYAEAQAAAASAKNGDLGGRRWTHRQRDLRWVLCGEHER